MKKALLGLFGGILLGMPETLPAQSSGSVLWSRPTEAEIRGHPIELPDGGIAVGTMEGRLFAFADDGSLRWELALGHDIFAAPAVSLDGMIYVGVDGRLHAIHTSGTERWAYATKGDIESSPTIAVDGTVVFGSNDESLYAVTANGGLRWRFVTQGKILSSPAIGADGTVYCGSMDHWLYAIRPDGRRRWALDTGGGVRSSPAIGPGGMILVGSDSRRLVAVSTNGVFHWAYESSKPISSSPAVAPDGTIYFGSQDGQLVALTAAGQLKWQLVATNSISLASPAVAADGTIYTASAAGVAYAVSAAGSIAWKTTGLDTLNAGALTLLSDGRLAVGSDIGNLRVLKGSSGPAVSSWPMFQRNPMHQAASFVLRRLAPTYSPGLVQVVTLLASPPATTTSYSVEDQPPTGWTVGAMSEGGEYDSRNRRVKFGPFMDGEFRSLRYELVPPWRETGNKFYSGTVAAGSWQGTALGDYCQTALPLHSADASPTDGRITLDELTTFILAWQLGTPWAPGPASIPGNYVDNAATLWRQGETYRYNGNLNAAPFWWVSATNGPKPVSLQTNATPAPLDASPLGVAVAYLPPGFQPNTPLTVTLQIRPAAGISVWAIEDTPPSGWTVSQISSGGTWDSPNRKVKWGPFYHSQAQQLSYQVRPPAGASNRAVFAGCVSFHGTNVWIQGQRETVANAPTNTWVRRQLPSTWAAGWRQTVLLEVQPPADLGYYVVEETPPGGWAITNISTGGVYDALHNIVRFGPFSETTPQTLSYDVIPSSGNQDASFFLGRVITDDFSFLVAGDDQIPAEFLHPADVNPNNSVLSLTELTAYAAAWKLGSSWVSPPSPIEISWVNQAIGLWQQGEGYHYVAGTTNAAQAWTPDPLRVSPGLSSLNTNFAKPTSGTAVAEAPANYWPGQLVTIQLQITPPNDTLVYGVEDIPPPQWVVTTISDAGWFDPVTRKVKWGPFFDSTARYLTYEVSTSLEGDATATFAGVACYDRWGLSIGGRRQMAPWVPARLEARHFDPVAGFTLSVFGGGTQVYEVQTSSNLVDWNAWLLLTNPPASMDLQDPAATNEAQRYYRAISY